MAKPLYVSLGALAAAVANNICQSQTPGAAGNLTLNGAVVTAGVAILDVARRVLITAAGNESAKTFTITGTNPNGNVITEILAGPNATTAATLNDFKTVTSIAISAAAAGALTVGTNGVASSRWLAMDDFSQGPVSIVVAVTGTVNYTVEVTLEDPNNPATWANPAISGTASTALFGGTASQAPTAIAANTNLTSKTGTLWDNLPAKPKAMRVTMNSGGTSGSGVTMTTIQAGGGGRS